MTRWVTSVTALALLCGAAFADSWPGRSEKGLRFFVDHAAFKASEGKALVEFYILLEAAQVQYVPEGNRFVGEMDLAVTVTDSAGTIVGESGWTRRVSVDDLSKLGEGGLPYRDVTGVQVAPGAYKVTVSVEDMFGDLVGELSLPIEVADFGSERFAASDVVLASSIEPATKASRFTKSGFEVIPNATRRHLVGAPLNAFVELYNLSPGETDRAKTFVLGYSLTDTSGAPVRKFPPSRFKKPGASAVKALKAKTDGLKPGRYFFEVEAFDSGSRQHVRKRRSVVLVGEGSSGEEELTEDQLRQLKYYRYIEPLAEKDDLKVYEQLATDDQAKMKFLRQFWKKLDPTPDTDINERLIEHLRRMRHSDDYFSGRAGQPGSETAMGRVYIQYGAPDDVERDVSGVGTKPFEVWHYGRYEFVFQDRNALGHYELVHSTYPGELNNPMWRQQTF